MDKYENLEIVGEGSYGVVIKCKHRKTGQIVAIKKFFETEDDVQVRKMVFREIRMLKKLRHENLVNMIEVFRRRRRIYVVFEYLDHTILDELEAASHGLGAEVARRYIFQVLRGLEFCHANNIMHRDIKPENVLVSLNGVIKLCDFGFARLVGGPNESCTDYVATRWYRAPELLVGDTRYGKSVDIWAVGCLYAEMISGDPLFPGESDVDQLHRITKVLGGMSGKSQTIGKNGNVRMLRHASVEKLSTGNKNSVQSLRTFFPTLNSAGVNFLAQCLRMDSDSRPKASTLLQHALFVQDGFARKFIEELRRSIVKETGINSLLNPKFQDRTNESINRISSSSTGRWQMTLWNDTRFSNDNNNSDLDNFKESPGEKRQSASQMNRPREISYFAPVSIMPNATYIRKLKQTQDFSQSLPNRCTLPALTRKDYLQKTTRKRKKLDLPNVDR